MRRNHKGSGRRFLQLYSNVKRSEAYHSLSCGARAALLELLDKYNGINNGMIGMGTRELADRLNCSKQGASNFLNELDDSGLAHPITVGVWRGKRATEWRLVFYRCDKTGELPTLNWKPRSQSTTKDTKVHEVGHKATLSQRGRTQEPKSSMIEEPLSQRSSPHIYIYHTPTDQSASPTPRRRHVGERVSPNIVKFVVREREAEGTDGDVLVGLKRNERPHND